MSGRPPGSARSAARRRGRRRDRNNSRKRATYPVTVQGAVAARSVELTGSAEAITMSALREFKIGKHLPPGNKTAPPRAPTT